jgi:3-hydroxyacyl-CoA dehydrogenase
VEAVAASTLPLPDGLARERALFRDCMASPQRAALIHAFFAERAVAKIPETGATPRAITTVGVVGAGTMGRGIAASLLIAGLPVTLIEPSPEARQSASNWLTETLQGAVKRGKLSEADATQARAALRVTSDLPALAPAALVIEAVIEDMEAKRAIFAALDRICAPDAILATNTSYLDIRDIAAATTHPARVLGLHFFAPAHIMRLLEVVVLEGTAPEVVATGFALAKRLRKIAVRAGVCDGFIGNRILTATRAEAEAMVLEGTDPAAIDAALEAAGFAMGPFATADLSGLDIAQAARARRGTKAPLPDALCARGWLGRKSGRGYYDYDGKARRPNPELPAILSALRRSAREPLTAEQIMTRYLRAMADEGARIVAEGIALRPVDVDAVMLFGYGFPRHLGGPMHWADMQG